MLLEVLNAERRLLKIKPPLYNGVTLGYLESSNLFGLELSSLTCACEHFVGEGNYV